MEQILNLIKKIGFVQNIIEYGLYDMYSYKTYVVYIHKETLLVSITDKRIEDMIFFNMDLEDREEFEDVINFLKIEFKYELRKIKIDGFLN